VPHHPADTDNLPSKEKLFMQGTILFCNIDGARFVKENLPYRSLEDRQHHSDTPQPLNGRSFLNHWVSRAQH